MLVLSLLVLTAGLALAYEEYDIDQAEDLFEDFIQDYNRVYKDDQEKQMRFNIFKEHLHEINEQNKQHGYNVMGINEFADISKEEFKSKYLGYVPNGDSQCSPPSELLKKPPGGLPENFDWRDKGVLPKVYGQTACGSCWAFSTIANVESHYAIKHGKEKLIKLSEQQLIDCDKTDLGCDGGDVATALNYIKNQGGVMSRKDYPFQIEIYVAEKHNCTFDRSKVKVQVTGCVDFSNTPEDDIKALLVNHGPLSIALAGEPFLSYEKGIFKGCQSDAKIDHALLVIGYGTGWSDDLKGFDKNWKEKTKDRDEWRELGKAFAQQ